MTADRDHERGQGVAVLLLAAGGSHRLGRPKQLVDWGGQPLLGHVLAEVSAWPAERVVAVLGAAAEEVLDAVEFGDAEVVINPEWEEGLASSLRVGLDALSRDARIDAAFLALGDQPGVPEDVPGRLLAEYRTQRSHAVVPKYRYARGNPVLADRRLWPRLMSLVGDEGARRLLQAHPEWVTEVWLDTLPPRDVDTEDDVAELRPRR